MHLYRSTKNDMTLKSEPLSSSIILMPAGKSGSAQIQFPGVGQNSLRIRFPGVRQNSLRIRFPGVEQNSLRIQLLGVGRNSLSIPTGRVGRYSDVQIKVGGLFEAPGEIVLCQRCPFHQNAASNRTLNLEKHRDIDIETVGRYYSTQPVEIKYSVCVCENLHTQNTNSMFVQSWYLVI